MVLDTLPEYPGWIRNKVYDPYCKARYDPCDECNHDTWTKGFTGCNCLCHVTVNQYESG